jgi:hypothetical protein
MILMIHMGDRTYLSGWKLNPEQKKMFYDNIKAVNDHVFYNLINIILTDMLLWSLSSTKDLMAIFNKP